ncbi:hypothetical protein CH063_01918 [Colletotrichum higginsianum]|uniref:Uncharacterized protein n=2 Tax=Colletotrichum higginsianum TaxID=80884 RepID=H1VE19_COLHI|nr:hypothetical protein CH63R_08400 [Colletotrichum higginsianum IMI 349063]OBR09635.1 hypothetical protein CH63R_08400 [Colletotrichum higginsianum IMI 349063]TIC96052.1 hypothetical protein CH35J_007790 [Colletotrichum higginsianum]CCF38472.1 hypothetical protein CH063_01918 [Colletotrichum higginsianum]
MFLHSGASLHGHEYSNKPSANGPQPARRRILLRSSLGASPLPRASFSADDTESATQIINRRLSLQGPSPSPRPSVRRNRPVSDLLPRKDLVVRFEEEPTVVVEDSHGLDGVSEDEGSLVSEVSDTSTVIRSKRSRRAARQCTNYLLAYPPPKLRTKQRRFVQIRPRLLLQLQQLSSDKRPMPAIDVLPSSIIAGTVILPRLARRFPKMFRVKGQLGMNGLILAKSEDYDTPADDSDGDEKDLDKRDLVAVISPVARREGERRDSSDQTEIVLADGSVWTATQTSNGSYDFVHVDDVGQATTARWVRRNARPLSTATCTAVSTPAPASEYKFTFSILDPELRRHPVMATLTPTNLEILDNYTTVSQSSGRYPPTRPFSTDHSGSHEPSSPPSPALATTKRETHPVDETTRILIAVTSVWVSLRHGQGWASTPSPPASASSRPVHSRTVSGNSLCQTRASTFPVTSTEMSQITSPPLAQQQQVMAQLAPVIPKRTFSSGAAFMHRRQTKLEGEAVTTDHAAYSDDMGRLEKVLEPVPIKRTLSRRIRDWGHRLTSRKTAAA